MLTQKRLKELLHYDSETGVFIWKVNKANNAQINNAAGYSNSNGYRDIRIDWKLYRAHRLAWLYMEGYFPAGCEIDHIDQNPANNAWSNLRLASHQCNIRNCKIRKDNKTGVKGVYLKKENNKWWADIRITGKTIYLGIYKDFDEAVCARLAGEQCVGWNGCDTNSPAYKYVKNNIQKKAK